MHNVNSASWLHSPYCVTSYEVLFAWDERIAEILNLPENMPQNLKISNVKILAMISPSKYTDDLGLLSRNNPSLRAAGLVADYVQ